MLAGMGASFGRFTCIVAGREGSTKRRLTCSDKRCRSRSFKYGRSPFFRVSSTISLAHQTRVRRWRVRSPAQSQTRVWMHPLRHTAILDVAHWTQCAAFGSCCELRHLPSPARTAPGTGIEPSVSTT